MAIGYTAPIFISLLAVRVLGERPSRWSWLALALGLAGSVVAVWPALWRGQWQGLLGFGAAAVSALTFAGVMVLARLQAQQDSPWTILLLQNLLPTLALALPVSLVWQPLWLSDLPLIALAGAFATLGLLALTWALTHLEASRVAPIEYTGLVWAAVIGYFVFAEVPTLYTLSSAALIVSGCLLLLRR